MATAEVLGYSRSRIAMCTLYGMARQTERFDMRMDPELREAIEKIAEARDRPIAWVVREALKRYVQQEAGPTQP